MSSDGPFAACPHCRAVFRVPPSALRAARGRVRCGACGGAFDALATLAGRPAGALALLPAPEHREPARAPHAQWQPMPPRPDDGASPAAPRFPFPEPAPPRRRGVWWALAATLLLLALVLQTVVTLYAPLRARLPSLAPALDAVCRHLPCRRPTPRIDGVTVIARDLREHPLLADTVLLNMALRNDAPAPRAAPLIDLVLYDQRGGRVAARRLTPADYLPPGTRARLAAGQSLFLTVEAAGPVADAAGFELRLLPPPRSR